MSNEFDPNVMLEELDAGIFMAKVGRAIKDVAMGVHEQGRDGEVTVKLKMKRIGESSQIMLLHTVAMSQPNLRGTTKRDDTTATVMHIGSGGKLSIIPDTQQGLDFDNTPAKER